MILELAGWCAGWAVLGRIRNCAKLPNECKNASEVSVIVPARNEEGNLATLLRSIATQSIQPREVIVVDDVSDDRTAEIAHEHGARVVNGAPPPENWRGKTWACHQGAGVAAGDIFLFLDADTWLESDGWSRLLAEFCAVGGGALSIAPHHAVRTFHEQFSAFFNLVMLASTRAFTILGDRLPARGLFGQCLLIERSAYERVGGYEAVKDCVLENFSLGQKLRAAGVAVHCRAGRGVIAMRMYPGGWRELIDGWSKGFAAGAGQTEPLALVLIIVWISALTSTAFHLALHPQSWLIVYALFAVQVGWLLRRVGTFHWLTAALFPGPLFFFFVVFARSVLRARRKKGVLWKGRPLHVA